MTHRRRSHRGHRFHDIINQGHARTHLGDMYVENQTIYNSWEQASSERNDDKRIDILEALAFDHMDTRLLSVGAPYGQTCRWLFDTHEYIEWRRSLSTGSRRRFLWIKGKPGAGKSTMMKLALEQASEHFPRGIVASFFFSARGHGAAKTIEGMYRSLLHQILTKLPRLPSKLPSHIGKSVIRDGWPVLLLQNLLQEALLALPQGETLIFYVDALDESNKDDIRLALKHFEELVAQSLLRNIGFLICLASRHYPNISIGHHRAMNLDSQAAHSDDVSEYVHNALKVPGPLGGQICASINDRCAGIFLWAVLTVGIINKSHDEGATRSQLQARLREVPDSIQALFSNVLQERDEYLLPTLQWVLFSQRALEVEELYFAVMTSVGHISTGFWDRAEIDITRMESFILQSSKGLIEVKHGIAQFIHESVREYLLGGGLVQLDPSLEGHAATGSHAKLAQWCQTYVALDTSYHCEHQDEPDETIFDSRRRIDVDTWYVPSLIQLPFLSYALSATTHHMQIAFDDDELSLTALGRFADLWLNLALHRYSGAAHYECVAVLCFLLARHLPNLDSGALGRSTPKDITSLDARQFPLYTDDSDFHMVRKPSSVLQNAANFASIDIARFFRDRRQVQSFQTLVEGALFLSAGLGLDHVLEPLLEYAAWMKGEALNNALGPAALGLQTSTTKELLRLGAHPDGCRSAYSLSEFIRDLGRNCTLLDLLAFTHEPQGYEGNADEARMVIATELLDSHATFKYALMGACLFDRVRLARLLINRGARVNLRVSNSKYSSALSIARRRGHDKIVRILKKSGATRKTKARDGDSSGGSMIAEVGED